MLEFVFKLDAVNGLIIKGVCGGGGGGAAAVTALETKLAKVCC